jgi:hypothetical protein
MDANDAIALAFALLGDDAITPIQQYDQHQQTYKLFLESQNNAPRKTVVPKKKPVQGQISTLSEEEFSELHIGSVILIVLGYDGFGASLYTKAYMQILYEASWKVAALITYEKGG